MRVLTVCLGNICRSPTAEAAIREAAASVGLVVDVDSAGTGDWHIGELPDARMRAAGAAAGLQIAGRARQIDARDLADFELVLAMDSDNLRIIRSLAGATSSGCEIELFRSWDPDTAAHDLDMPDPYYGGPDGFEEVVRICRRTARALVDDLVSR